MGKLNLKITAKPLETLSAFTRTALAPVEPLNMIAEPVEISKPQEAASYQEAVARLEGQYNKTIAMMMDKVAHLEGLLQNRPIVGTLLSEYEAMKVRNKELENMILAEQDTRAKNEYTLNVFQTKSVVDDATVGRLNVDLAAASASLHSTTQKLTESLDSQSQLNARVGVLENEKESLQLQVENSCSEFKLQNTSQNCLDGLPAQLKTEQDLSSTLESIVSLYEKLSGITILSVDPIERDGILYSSYPIKQRGSDGSLSYTLLVPGGKDTVVYVPGKNKKSKTLPDCLEEEMDFDEGMLMKFFSQVYGHLNK